MGLLDLKTDLKSLTFGDPPYITKDVDTEPSRGRVNQLEKRFDDLKRIGKMLADRPGARYLTAEALLQQGDLTEKLNNIVRDPATGALDLIDSVAQTVVSLPSIVASTLAQVPVNGTGTHFIKGFGVGLGDYLEDNPILIQTEDVQGSLSIADARSIAESEFTQSGSYIGGVKDFRQGPYSFDYSNRAVNRETRVNLGNQAGARDRSNYNIAAPEEVKDKINALGPVKDEFADLNVYRDFIKFRFKVLRPGTDGAVLYFRAFLDNFSDSYNANWSEHQYVGRAEPFYTYGGFSRSFSLSFKVAAATRDEMKPIYQKIVWLASTTAPTYSDTFMKGTFVELTVGDYLYRTPGFFSSINYQWDKGYPWEIAFQGPEETADQDQQELPHVLNVSCEFTPIHKFVPTTGYNHYITNPNAQESRFFQINEEIGDKVKVKKPETRGVVEPTAEQQRPTAGPLLTDIDQLGV